MAETCSRKFETNSCTFTCCFPVPSSVRLYSKCGFWFRYFRSSSVRFPSLIFSEILIIAHRCIIIRDKTSRLHSQGGSSFSPGRKMSPCRGPSSYQINCYGWLECVRASYKHLFQSTLCLKKRHPFYFCDICVKFHPILLIFGRNMLQKFETNRCTCSIHISFYMFVLYLVKTSDA